MHQENISEEISEEIAGEMRKRKRKLNKIDLYQYIYGYNNFIGQDSNNNDYFCFEETP